MDWDLECWGVCWCIYQLDIIKLIMAINQSIRKLGFHSNHSLFPLVECSSPTCPNCDERRWKTQMKQSTNSSQTWPTPIMIKLWRSIGYCFLKVFELCRSKQRTVRFFWIITTSLVLYFYDKNIIKNESLRERGIMCAAGSLWKSHHFCWANLVIWEGLAFDEGWFMMVKLSRFC